MFEQIIWTFLLFLIGLISLPSITILGKDLFYRGIALAPFVGMVTITLLTWLFTNLGLVQFSQLSLLLSILGWTIFNCVILIQNIDAQKWIRTHLIMILMAQLLFFIPFLGHSFIRTFNPNIDNFEKFMDMNYLSALLRTETFPPQDTWFAGESINYYYFGHLTAASMVKLSGVPNDVGYNLSVSTYFGWAVVTSFALVSSLLHIAKKSTKASLKGGILGALVVTCAGTLYTFSYLFEKELAFYWFWSAIRLIPYSIHEFPGYSFAVADLHAHMMNVPFVLSSLLVTLIITQNILHKANLQKWIATCVLGINLGIIVMTSAWDFPMYAGVAGLSLLFSYWVKTKTISQSIVFSIFDGVVILLSTFITTFFFWKYFDSSIAGGIGFVTAHTSLKDFLILWGPQLLVGLGAVYFIIKKRAQVPFAFRLALLWLVWAGVLLVVPEVIYLKDIYGELNHRLNTILKFYYQAFVISGISVSFFVLYLFSEIEIWWQRVWQLAVVLLLSCMLVFPFQILPDYYNDFSEPQGLGGKDFMKWELADDRLAIDWINQNIKGQPVLVEAAGDSYTSYSRISTFTGVPTILGWYVHEWLWRGGAEKPSRRADDVALLYQGNSDQMQQIINNYRVEYIYIGNLERQKYPNINAEVLRAKGTLVYSNQSVEIIKIH